MNKKLLKLVSNKQVFTLMTQGTSMLPLLHPNDIITYKRVQFNQISVNDIVMCQKHEGISTHRVIYKTEKYLITKGDNNPQSDGKIFPKALIAKVLQIKRDQQVNNLDNMYLLQSTHYFHEIVKIKGAFEKQNINHVFLKGLPLHLYFEKTHPRRIYVDCDVLITKPDFLKAKKELIRMGYKKVDSTLSKSQAKHKEKETEISYYKLKSGVAIVFDLHIEVVFMMTQLSKLDSLYEQRLINTLTDEFLETKKSIRVQGYSFFILNPHFLVLYLALHFFHHNFNGAFRLDFLDKVIRRLRFSSSAWQNINRTIVKYKLTNFVYPAFLLLKKYYKTPIPLSFYQGLHSQSTNDQKSFLSINIFDEEPRLQSGVNRLKNLFLLSPEPLWRRLTIILNPEVIYLSVFVLKKLFKAKKNMLFKKINNEFK